VKSTLLLLPKRLRFKPVYFSELQPKSLNDDAVEKGILPWQPGRRRNVEKQKSK
jgi:hypothetical protein